MKTSPVLAQPIVDLDAMLQKLLSEDEFIVGTPIAVADQIVTSARQSASAYTKGRNLRRLPSHCMITPTDEAAAISSSPADL